MRKLILLSCLIAATFASKSDEDARKESVKGYCDACYQNIKSCLAYNYESGEARSKVQRWASCVEKGITEWRESTGMKWWPDPDVLSEGTVGVAPGGYGRLQCINYMLLTESRSGCDLCYAGTKQASDVFEKHSKRCGGQ